MKRTIKHFLIILLVFLMSANVISVFAADTIKITRKMTAENCTGKRIGRVKKLYTEAGFTNLQLVKRQTDKEEDSGLVYHIRIDGNDEFSAGDTFDKDAKVVIWRWVYNDNNTTAPVSTIAPSPSPTPTPTPIPSPTPTPIPTPTPVPEYNDATTVMNVQEALNIFGYNCGTPDGVIGPMTRDAVTAYQANHGLTANGYITSEFITVLNYDIDEYNRSLPTPTPIPVEPAEVRSVGGGGFSYTPSGTAGTGSYVLNWNTMKFHYPSCPSVPTIAAHNREDVYMSKAEILGMGFEPCGRCDP